MSSSHHPPQDLDLNSDVSPPNMVTNNEAPIQNEIRVIGSGSETLGFMGNQGFNLKSGVLGNDGFSRSGYRRDYGFFNTGDGHGGRVGFDGVPGSRVGMDLSGGLDSLYYPGSRDGGRVGYNVVPESICIGRTGQGAGARVGGRVGDVFNQGSGGGDNVVPESICVGRIGLGADARVTGRVGDVFNPGSGGGGRGGYNVAMENYGIDVGMGGRVDALFNPVSGHGGRVVYNGVHEEMSGDHVRMGEGADLGSRVDALFNPVGGDRGRFGYKCVHENMSGDHVRMGVGVGVDLGGRVDALFSPVNGDRERVGFNAVPENFNGNRARMGDSVDIGDRVDALINPVNGDGGRVGFNAVPGSLNRDHVRMGAGVNLSGRVDALFNPASKDEGRVGYDVVRDKLSLESVGVDVDLGGRVDALFNPVSEDRGRVGFKVVQDNLSLDRVGMGVNVNFENRVDALFNTVNGDEGRVGCTAVPENSSGDHAKMDGGSEIESGSVRGLWSENKELKVGVGESSVLKTADVKIGVKGGQITESNVSEVEDVEGVHENQAAVNVDFVGIVESHNKEEIKISQKAEGINAQGSEEFLIPVDDEGKTGVHLQISSNEVDVDMDLEMESGIISAIGTSCKNDVLEGPTNEILVKDDTRDVGTDMGISSSAKLGKIHVETPKQNTKSEIVRSVMHKKVEDEFSITDMVWGKVRSHPWWPGQIFKSSDASAVARKQPKKDNCYLVAYFGDASFAWNEASALKPFHANFTHLGKQSTQESFQVAVDCALDEASRRVEYGLSCPCVPEVGDNIIETQIIDNAGICIEERKRNVSEKVSVITSFEPEKLVKYMKRLALDVCSGRDRLEHVTVQAQLLAFNRSKGYAQLPEFYVYSGFTGIMIADVIPISRIKEEAPSRKRRPKRQDSSSDEYEQMEDGLGSSKNKKMMVSSRKRKSERQNSSSDEYDHVEDVSISRKNKRMGRTKTKLSDVDNGTSTKLNIPTFGKKRMRGRPRKETKTVARVPHGSNPKVGERIRKRGRPRKETKTVVQSADESDESDEDYSSDGSDDENYTVSRTPQGSKSKVRGRARRCASKCSKFSTFTKFSDKCSEGDEDLDIEQSDETDGAESPRTTKGSQIWGLATVKYNRTPIEMLSQLYLVAQNPLKLHKFLSNTVEFFTDFRNSISGANWSGKTEEDPLNKNDRNGKLESEKIKEGPLEKSDTNGKLELEIIGKDQLQKSGANGKLEREKIEEDAVMKSDADGKSESAEPEEDVLKKSNIIGKLESANIEEDALKNSDADGMLESAKTEEDPLKKSDTSGNSESEKIEEGATKSDADEKLESVKTEDDLLKKSNVNGKLGSAQIKEDPLMKSDTDGNLESEKIEEGATKSDADEKLESAKTEEDLLKKSDANGKLGSAQINEDPLKKSDEDLSPSGDSELILNFSNAESIPSEAALNEIFNHFSSLKHSETEILKKKKRAKVVFGIRSEAEEAFSKAGKFSIFGPALATYRLRYVPATPSTPASACVTKETS